MTKLKLCLLVCALNGVMAAQSSKAAVAPSPAAPKPDITHETDRAFTPSSDDLLADVQMTIRGNDRVGMVWWIPFEFWELSDESGKAAEAV